jgi:DNA-binding CsgD family transcriptional regulator
MLLLSACERPKQQFATRLPRVTAPCLDRGIGGRGELLAAYVRRQGCGEMIIEHVLILFAFCGCPVRPVGSSFVCRHQEPRWTSSPRSYEVSDRISERRRATQLARHYRDHENLTIAEIARRLGRAEATVKAYLYDPS